MQISVTTGSIILGKYRIKGPTLKGGTAVIRLATDEKTDKRVAIKLTASHQEAINELRILKNLRSPFIVSLEDSYILPQLSSPLIVMEQLDKSLNDFVRSKQLEVQAIKLILSHIISGVEYLHAANLVHCDLKPANIMLSSADIQWKIIDFGNSKTALADDVNGLTPMYCPPEVARAVLDNRPIKAHPSIDLWQIGVVIYYMFTRNLPFEGTEEKEILRQLAEPGFTLDVGGISDNQAKNLLIKLFTEDPKKRMALDKLKVFHILASHYYRLK
jgi:serine/threonine protein kinase